MPGLMSFVAEVTKGSSINKPQKNSLIIEGDCVFVQGPPPTPAKTPTFDDTLVSTSFVIPPCLIPWIN